jgi:hypothetical protein
MTPENQPATPSGTAPKPALLEQPTAPVFPVPSVSPPMSAPPYAPPPYGGPPMSAPPYAPQYSAQQYSAPPYPYQPYSGAFPVQPPPAKPHRVGLIVTVIVVILLLCAGVGLGGLWWLGSSIPTAAGSAPTAAHSQATEQTPSPSASPSPTPFTGDLRTLLLKPPAGSSPWDNPISPDGRLSLDQASSLFKDKAAAKRRFESYGYQGGAVVTWINPDDTDVSIKLYQFKTSDNANGYVDQQHEIALSEDWIDHSPITGIDSSCLFIERTPDKNNKIATRVYFYKGSFVIIMIVQQPIHAKETVSIKLATDQYNLLP